MVEHKVNAPVVINDGMHEGVIIAVEERTVPVKGKGDCDYSDVIIEFEEGKKIKDGYPTYICPTSKYGKMLEKFYGGPLEINSMVDPEQVLIGRKCSFMTQKEVSKKDGNEYANVVLGSLKPSQVSIAEQESEPEQTALEVK